MDSQTETYSLILNSQDTTNIINSTNLNSYTDTPSYTDAYEGGVKVYTQWCVTT